MLPLAAEEARSCADLERVNLAVAEEHMKKRGRPFRMPKYPISDKSDDPVRTGRDLITKIGDGVSDQCIATQGGFIGLILGKFDEEDGGDNLMNWSVMLDLLAYLPKGQDPWLAAMARRLKLNGCSFCPSEMGEVTATSCQLRAARDLDYDGKAEIFLSKHEQPHTTGCCIGNANLPTYACEIMSIVNSKVVPYKHFSSVEFADDRVPFIDYDSDGREDYWSMLGYKVPNECQNGWPEFLLHARADGTFAANDDTARAAARKWCPRPPPDAIDKIEPGQPATHLICARLWGESAEPLNAKLDRRCTRAVSHDEAETNDLPWAWCYHARAKCAYPDMLNLCGEWMKELTEIPPPFRFR